MTKVSRTTGFWLSVAAVSLVLLVVLRQILLPFVIGLTLAYLLSPLVSMLERRGIDRAFSTLTIMLLLVLGFVAFTLIMLPALVGEITAFVEALPRYLARIQSLAADANRPWVRKIVGHELAFDQPSTEIISGAGGHWFDDVLRSLWSGGNALLSLVSLLVVAPIVAIYVTIDWDKMITTVDTWIAAEHRNEVRALGREINDTIAGFVRGQSVICILLAAFYAAVLRAIGLDHGIAIGLIAGFISFVPYLGAGIGFVISMCVAISQFWPNWTPIVVVGSTFFVGEMLADYVLAPRIIGRRVKLNPVWLMFALFAFGALFGFIGLLLAVPLAASIGVLLRFAMRKSSPIINVATS